MTYFSFCTPVHSTSEDLSISFYINRNLIYRDKVRRFPDNIFWCFSADPYRWQTYPNPPFFGSDYQDAHKKSFLLITFWVLKEHLIILQRKKVTKKWWQNQVFSHYFCLMMEGSGSLLLTYGSGFGSRAQKLPDQEHWFFLFVWTGFFILIFNEFLKYCILSSVGSVLATLFMLVVFTICLRHLRQSISDTANNLSPESTKQPTTHMLWHLRQLAVVWRS